MKKTPTISVVFLDIIDFLFSTLPALILVIFHHHFIGNYQKIPFSIFFPEQFFEIFFQSPKLFWLFLIYLLINFFLYYFISVNFFAQTIGSYLVDIRFSRNHEEPVRWSSSLLYGPLKLLDCALFFLGPLYGWFMDKNHQGFSEKILGIQRTLL